MENNTNIIMLLDRSGSMESIKKETIKGFNSFIKKQMKSNPDAIISLSQFDDKYEVVYERTPIDDAPIINKKTYKPRGLTALLDAIGTTIIRQSSIIDESQSHQSTKTIFVIITDGLENASTEYSLKKVHSLIKKMEDCYIWQFVYLGANQDAVKVASSFGIDEKRAIRFAADILGTKDIFNTVSERVSESICYSQELRFKNADRLKQLRNESFDQ